MKTELTPPLPHEALQIIYESEERLNKTFESCLIMMFELKKLLATIETQRKNNDVLRAFFEKVEEEYEEREVEAMKDRYEDWDYITALYESMAEGENEQKIKQCKNEVNKLEFHRDKEIYRTVVLPIKIAEILGEPKPPKFSLVEILQKLGIGSKNTYYKSTERIIKAIPWTKDILEIRSTRSDKGKPREKKVIKESKT